MAIGAGAQDTCSFSIGMNLAAVTDWNKELPFVDVMKGSRNWITQNSIWVPGGENPWDSQVQTAFEYDENGYPMEVPIEVPGQEAPQCVATLMAREIDGDYPAGNYTVLYEGAGQLEFDFDAQSIISQSPGQYVINVVPGDGGIFMRIVQSDPDDHIRNIRVLMPGTSDTYQDQPFHQVFLDKIEPFPVLRFMNWGRTNNNPVVSWGERTTPTYFSQARPQGAAYENMVALCNHTGKDMWLCVPHQADSLFIAQLAELIHGSLDLDLKLYLEYTNEFWNGIFTQHEWIMNNAPDGIGGEGYNGPWPHKYAWFSERVFSIFLNQFEGEEDRVVRVVSGQHYNPWIMEQILIYLGEDGADAISPAAYFSFGGEGEQVLNNLGANATPQDIVPFIRDEMVDVAYPLLQDHKALADEYGMDLLLYEAGQHVTTMPFGSSQPYQQAIWDLQTDTAMYNLYDEWMAILRDSLESELVMHYVLASEQNSQYGSWGSLETILEPAPYSPKYQALVDNIPDCSLVTEISSQEPNNIDALLFVNPLRNVLQPVEPLSGVRELVLYQTDGKVVLHETYPVFPLEIGGLSMGMYVVQLLTEDGMKRQKILIDFN